MAYLKAVDNLLSRRLSKGNQANVHVLLFLIMELRNHSEVDSVRAT